MDNAPPRVGVIGCGFFAQNQIAVWAAMEGVTLAAVCDLDAEKAAAAAAKFGAVAYRDAAEMLAKEKLDFSTSSQRWDRIARSSNSPSRIGFP